MHHVAKESLVARVVSQASPNGAKFIQEKKKIQEKRKKQKTKHEGEIFKQPKQNLARIHKAKS